MSRRIHHAPKRATFTGTPVLAYERDINWVAVYTGLTITCVLVALGVFAWAVLK